MDGRIVRETAEAVVDHDHAGLAFDSGEFGAAVGHRHGPSVRLRVMFRRIALQGLHIVVRRIERNRQQPDPRIARVGLQLALQTLELECESLMVKLVVYRTSLHRTKRLEHAVSGTDQAAHHVGKNEREMMGTDDGVVHPKLDDQKLS